MLWDPFGADLGLPLRWQSRHTVWQVRRTDMFADGRAPEAIAAAFGVMAAAPLQTFFLRTRRADVMARWFAWVDREALGALGDPAAFDLARTARCLDAARDALGPAFDPPTPPPWPLANVALGVRATRQYELDDRLGGLLDAPAALRFVDADPLRERIDFRGFARLTCPACLCAAWSGAAPRGAAPPPCRVCGATAAPAVRAVRWLKLSGDCSGEAAPFDLAWAAGAVAQSRAAGVRVCVQRLGANPVRDGARWPCADPRGEAPAEWPEALRERARPWPPFERHPLDTNTLTGWPVAHCQNLDAAPAAGDSSDPHTPPGTTP